MEQWVPAGKAAVPCTCSCLPDGVQLDMGIFCPELRHDSSGACVWGAGCSRVGVKGMRAPGAVLEMTAVLTWPLPRAFCTARR